MALVSGMKLSQFFDRLVGMTDVLREISPRFGFVVPALVFDQALRVGAEDCGGALARHERPPSRGGGISLRAGGTPWGGKIYIPKERIQRARGGQR